MACNVPVLGICGWSGSGKTTLIETILPELRRRGLRVAVVKHDAHGIQVDRAGKDSDRLFRAGADVLLGGPGQDFVRSHKDVRRQLAGILTQWAQRYDLVLVEGHKTCPVPKLWLLADGERQPPGDVEGVLARLTRDANRPEAAMAFLNDWLPRQWRKTPVLGCVLIGGKSRRMGRPKHLLRRDGRTWLERTVSVLQEVTSRVVLVGEGRLPRALRDRARLADVPDAAGPLSGVLAAMRWAPQYSWLVAACDMPAVSSEALRWLLGFRRPGVWAAMPRLVGSPGVEPLLAYYDVRSRQLLEDLPAGGGFKPADIADHEKVICPQPPADLAAAWRNVNTPTDLESYGTEPVQRISTRVR